MTHTTVYEPNSRLRMGLIKTFALLIKNVIESRELIYQLFKRDFLMSYKKSFLGMSWHIIAPIMGIISWVFMNYTGILAPGDVGIPYPAYILLSTTIFGLFMNFYTAASGTLTAGSGFIMQVNFPHEALLAKQVLQQLVAFSITFVVSLGVLFAFGVVPSYLIIFFPLLIIPMMMLGVAIGLVSCIVNVVAPDIQRGIVFLMSLLMYVTPVIYSSNINNAVLRKVIAWNPLTYLIGGVRDAIIYGYIANFDRFIYSSLLALVIFVLTWRIFFITEEKIIEKMI